MNKIFNVGIVGLGYWYGNIIKNILKLSDKFKVICGCDLNPDHLNEFSIQFPEAQAYQNHKEMLQDKNLDVVFILTSPSSHFEIARDCILAGRNCWIEKPLTLHYHEAQELVRLKEEKNVHVVVDNTFVFSEEVKQLKHFFLPKLLGDIYYFDSIRSNYGPFNLGGLSIISDLLPHDLSILRYLFGNPVSVSATGNFNLVDGFADIAKVSFAYWSFHANVSVSYWSAYKERTIDVGGTNKILHLDFCEKEHYLFDIQSKETTWLTLDKDEPLLNELNEFYDVLIGIATSRASIYDGADIVRILEKVEVSIRNGGAPEYLQHV
jgi:predicted dehydrogenase